MARNGFSPHEATQQPHDEAQHDAENDAGCDGEEDGCGFSAVADVAWQSPQRNIRPTCKHHDDANHDQQSAGNDQELA